MQTFSEMRSNAKKLKIQDTIEKEIVKFLSRGARPKPIGDQMLKGLGGPKAVSGFEVRNWGVWEVPQDEYDDGDYDWQVLDQKSAKEMNKFIAKMDKKSSKFSVSWTQEEKNWISVIVRRN